MTALCTVCYFKIHFVSDVLYIGRIRWNRAAPQTVSLLFHLFYKLLVNCCRRRCARIFDIVSKVPGWTNNGGCRIHIIPDILSGPVFYLSYDSLQGGVHSCVPSTIFRLFKCCVCSPEKGYYSFPTTGLDRYCMFTSRACIPHMSVSHRDQKHRNNSGEVIWLSSHFVFQPAQPQQPLLSASAIGSTRRRDNVRPGPRWRGPERPPCPRSPASGWGSRAAAAPRPGRETPRPYLPPTPSRRGSWGSAYNAVTLSGPYWNLLQNNNRSLISPMTTRNKHQFQCDKEIEKKKVLKAASAFFFCCSDLLRQSDGKDKKLSSGKYSEATILSSLNKSRVFADDVVDVKVQSYLNSMHMQVKLKSIQVTRSSKPQAGTLTWHSGRKVS